MSLWMVLGLSFCSMPDEASFVDAIEQSRSSLQGGAWDEAREQLLSAIDAEGEQSYVVDRRPAIVDLLRQAAVREANPAPELESLISGRLRSYNRRSGKIHLEYSLDDLADFEDAGDGVFLHPMRFDGPYKVEFSGPGLTSVGRPRVYICVRDDEYFFISPGFVKESGLFRSTLPGQIIEVVGESVEVKDEAEEPPVKLGVKYSLVVNVSSRQVGVRWGSKTFMDVKKRKDLWGGFGLAGFPAKTEVKVTGKVTSSWARGLVDEAMREKDDAFLAAFDVDALLPEWLHEGRPSTAEGPAELPPLEPEEYPWLMDSAQLKNVEVVHRAIATGRKADAEQAVAAVEQAGAGAFPLELRDYLLASLYVQLGRLGEAEARIELLLESTTNFSGLHSLDASVNFAYGRFEDAIEACDAALALRPREESPNVLRCHSLLRLGRNADAREALRVCRQMGVRAEPLRQLATMVLRADSGPDWPRRFDVETEHFLVASDLDRASCNRAAKVLDEIFGVLAEHLGPLGDDAKARVYLFAGEAGYRSYTRDVFPGFMHSTAGLYNGYLKQLVVWNLPNREEWEHTLRHECVHLYLDRMGTELPTWFEEGLAEYLSHVRKSRLGRVRDVGAIHGPSARLLNANRRSMVPLSAFLGLQGDAFYGLGPLGYPQAWAFVHFLMTSEEAGEAAEKMLDGSKRRMGVRRTIAHAFDGVDMAALEEAFLRHVERLDES